MKFLPFLVVLILMSCGSDEEVLERGKAVIQRVTQLGTNSYEFEEEIVGEVIIRDFGGKSTFAIRVQGLIPNWSHAIHIHLGNCSEPGAHWNRGDTTSYCNETNLGEIWARPKAGDVGNVKTDDFGDGYLEVDSEFWRIGSGDSRDLIGSVVIIHESPEDFAQECFQQHNHVHSNRKIACGTIELE